MTQTPTFPLMLATIALFTLSGCEQLGIESPAQVAARQEAEGKAVGGACRHAARALEDCYQLNRKASKAAIYAGWRDMDAYMRENKIDPIVPQGDREEAAAKSSTPETAKAESAPAPAEAQKPAEAAPAEKKGSGKHAALLRALQSVQRA